MAWSIYPIPYTGGDNKDVTFNVTTRIVKNFKDSEGTICFNKVLEWWLPCFGGDQRWYIVVVAVTSHMDAQLHAISDQWKSTKIKILQFGRENCHHCWSQLSFLQQVNGKDARPKSICGRHVVNKECAQISPFDQSEHTTRGFHISLPAYAICWWL